MATVAPASQRTSSNTIRKNQPAMSSHNYRPGSLSKNTSNMFNRQPLLKTTFNLCFLKYMRRITASMGQALAAVVALQAAQRSNSQRARLLQRPIALASSRLAHVSFFTGRHEKCCAPCLERTGKLVLFDFYPQHLFLLLLFYLRQLLGHSYIAL